MINLFWKIINNAEMSRSKNIFSFAPTLTDPNLLCISTNSLTDLNLLCISTDPWLTPISIALALTLTDPNLLYISADPDWPKYNLH